ncbi:MAG: hypothetical protein KAU95_02335 [Candidatus Aenigmarchaeota archaeon]|nr:hypothetical protein [Candidatus Aenigmarchaeota archaeon]
MDTKSLKEFFRPTKIKILLFICFTIVFYIETVNLFQLLNPGGELAYLSLAGILSTIILIPFFILCSSITVATTTLYIIMVIIASAISGYLFSCLIISLHKYFGKFKHNKILKTLPVIAIILLFFPMPINLLNSFNPVEPSEVITQSFTPVCETLCDEAGLFEYCAYYFGKGDSEIIDLNKNGRENDIIEIGNQHWSACESRVYCFLHHPCKRLGSTQKEVIERCSKLLCNRYLDKYSGNATLASKAVLDKIKISSNPTECNFFDVPERDNWHKRFFPENVCEIEKEIEEEEKEELPEEENKTLLSLSNCVLNTSDWSITCDTNCQQVMSEITMIVVKDKKGNITKAAKGFINTGDIKFLEGKIKFKTDTLLSTLESDTSLWEVGLVCSNPDEVKQVTGVKQI